jgi:predicted kinase
MPKMYVLVGVPGSGKSTWFENQEWTRDCIYVSTDKFIERCARWSKKTYSEVFGLYSPRAVNYMVRQVNRAKERGKDVIWDQTSTTIESRARKFRMLPDYYAIAVVFRTPEAEEHTRRLASRVGKEIPKEVVQSMINRWEEPTKSEGFNEIWYAE